MEDVFLDQVIEDTMEIEKIVDEKKRSSFRKRYLESLDVIDDDGKTIGAAPRGLVHRVGLRHRTVFILVSSPDDNLLLQTRGSAAASSPLRLDISVGGHVQAGETNLIRSAIREMQEELGFEPDSSRLLFVAEYNRNSPISTEKPYERNRERRILFEYRLVSQEMDRLNSVFLERLSKSEVANFGWFGVADVILAINEGRVADGLISNFMQWLAFTKTGNH